MAKVRRLTQADAAALASAVAQLVDPLEVDELSASIMEHGKHAMLVDILDSNDFAMLKGAAKFDRVQGTISTIDGFKIRDLAECEVGTIVFNRI